MLALPAAPRDFVHEVIEPALALFPVGFDSPEARCILLAIAKQESDLRYLEQIGGPARSPWMFERAGVLGVTMNHQVDDLAALACREAKIACAATDIMRRIGQPTGLLLACQLARLNLRKDPRRLPPVSLDARDEALQLYRGVWRPGAMKDPDSQRFHDACERFTHSWTVAVEAVHV